MKCGSLGFRVLGYDLQNKVITRNVSVLDSPSPFVCAVRICHWLTLFVVSVIVCLFFLRDLQKTQEQMSKCARAHAEQKSTPYVVFCFSSAALFSKGALFFRENHHKLSDIWKPPKGCRQSFGKNRQRTQKNKTKTRLGCVFCFALRALFSNSRLFGKIIYQDFEIPQGLRAQHDE